MVVPAANVDPRVSGDSGDGQGKVRFARVKFAADGGSQRHRDSLG